MYPNQSQDQPYYPPQDQPPYYPPQGQPHHYEAPPQNNQYPPPYAPQPPEEYTQQPPQPPFQQPLHSHPPPPQRSHSPQPPQQHHQQQPYTLILTDAGKHADTLNAPHSAHPVFTIAYNTRSFSSGPDVTVSANASVLGTVKYHTWTSKLDITISCAALSAAFTYKDDFASNVPGVGRLFWTLVGPRRDGNLRLRDGQGGVVATFEANRLRVYRPQPGLLEEVVVTVVAEIEGLRRERENERAGTLGAIAGASGGFGS